MNRRINHLTQVFQELRDRYGSDDPVVVQLKESLDQISQTESLSSEARLPFGERRTMRTKPSYWNVKLRHADGHINRRDILAQCTRVEFRAFN